MKKLPKNLKVLELYLKYNMLGENSDNLKCIGEGMKQLPCGLQNLTMNLNG